MLPHDARIRFGPDLLHPGPVEQRYRFVVADRGDVDGRLEYGAFVPELEVDGLHRNAGSFGYLLQPRGRVAVVDEQLGGRVDIATFRGAPDRPVGWPGAA